MNLGKFPMNSYQASLEVIKRLHFAKELTPIYLMSTPYGKKLLHLTRSKLVINMRTCSIDNTQKTD